ncbi:MAG: hypothetical protein FJZ13_04715 [Candidatus Omnitrophica bacterium]|nr:hypothetical protein [Candidatus Omnitrophota bacterium]
MKDKPIWLTIVTIVIALTGGVSGVINIVKFYREKAHFIANIQGMVTGNIIQNNKESTFIFLALIITNHGEKALTPSTFECYIRDKRKWTQLKKLLIPEQMKFGSNESSINIEEPHKNDLQRLKKSISYGEPVNGFLLFEVPHYNLENLLLLLQKKRSIKLVCIDEFENRYSKIFNRIAVEVKELSVYPKLGIKVEPIQK